MHLASSRRGQYDSVFWVAFRLRINWCTDMYAHRKLNDRLNRTFDRSLSFFNCLSSCICKKMRVQFLLDLAAKRRFFGSIKSSVSRAALALPDMLHVFWNWACLELFNCTIYTVFDWPHVCFQNHELQLKQRWKINQCLGNLTWILDACEPFGFWGLWKRDTTWKTLNRICCSPSMIGKNRHWVN